MSTVRRTVTSVILSVGMLFLFAPLVTAAVAPPALTLSPSSGPANTEFTIGWSGFTVCRAISLTYSWNGGAPATGSPGTTGSTTSTVPPGTSAGSYTITATCSNSDITQTAKATFRVTATVTTQPTPPTTTVPPPPTTTVRIPPTTRNPATTTPTTTPPSTIPPTTAPTTPTPVTPTPTGSGLSLNHGTVQAGDALSASGVGCLPGHPVTLTSGGDRVGRAVADGSGSFTAPVVFTTITPGTHVITADCGVTLTVR